MKPGFSHGATDDFGYHAVESPVDLHDLHATVLHLLGLDHTRLTYRYSGRDFRLTDVSGRVVREIIVCPGSERCGTRPLRKACFLAGWASWIAGHLFFNLA